MPKLTVAKIADLIKTLRDALTYQNQGIGVKQELDKLKAAFGSKDLEGYRTAIRELVLGLPDRSYNALDKRMQKDYGLNLEEYGRKIYKQLKQSRKTAGEEKKASESPSVESWSLGPENLMSGPVPPMPKAPKIRPVPRPLTRAVPRPRVNLKTNPMLEIYRQHKALPLPAPRGPDNVQLVFKPKARRKRRMPITPVYPPRPAYTPVQQNLPSPTFPVEGVGSLPYSTSASGSPAIGPVARRLDFNKLTRVPERKVLPPAPPTFGPVVAPSTPPRIGPIMQGALFPGVHSAKELAHGKHEQRLWTGQRRRQKKNMSVSPLGYPGTPVLEGFVQQHLDRKKELGIKSPSVTSSPWSLSPWTPTPPPGPKGAHITPATTAKIAETSAIVPKVSTIKRGPPPRGKKTVIVPVTKKPKQVKAKKAAKKTKVTKAKKK